MSGKIVKTEYLKLLACMNPKYRNSKYWARLVKRCLARDKSCKACGSKRNPEVHHKNGSKDFWFQRLDLKNVARLCFDCHRGKPWSMHSVMGGTRKKVTEADYNKWLSWVQKYV